MTSFRRSAMSNSQQKKSGGGGGNWKDAFRIPKEEATPFVLVNSEYVDENPPPDSILKGPNGEILPVKNAFYKYRAHTRKLSMNGYDKFITVACTQGNDPHNPKPCAACMAQEMGDKSISTSDKFVFTIVHLVPYHKHPQIDYQTGGYKTNKEGQPYYTYSECEGRTCNFCRVMSGQQPIRRKEDKYNFPNYNPADITTEFGHRRYIEIGKGHLSNLEGWDASITNQCSAHITDGNGNLIARCGNQLTSESWNCPNCGNVIIDMSSDPRSDAEIASAVSRPYPCLTCQKSVLLEEQTSCDSCSQAGRTMSQLGLFDVVVWGKKHGEQMKSQLTLHKFQTIEEFQRTLPSHITPLLQGRSVFDVIKDHSKPFDFEKFLGPLSLEEQSKRLQLNMQNMNQPQSAYGAPQQFQNQQFLPEGQVAVPPPPIGGMVMNPPYAPYPPQQTPQHNVPGPQGFHTPMKPNFGK